MAVAIQAKLEQSLAYDRFLQLPGMVKNRFIQWLVRVTYGDKSRSFGDFELERKGGLV